MPTAKSQQNYINHIALVLDKSGSMQGSNAHALVIVADQLIKDLAVESQAMDQETRVSVYTFADTAECVVWDKDVLRLPSIKDFYNPHGQTALIDAALLSIGDLAMTPEKYGDHSFLIYVLTDGQENHSRHTGDALKRKIEELPEHWTVAALVPDVLARRHALGYGFPAGNIVIWDTASGRGVEEAGKQIKAATSNFMQQRTYGVRGTQSLFKMADLDRQTVVSSGLPPLDPKTFQVIPVTGIPAKQEIRDYVVNKLGLPYTLGRCFYQLSKPEKIQPQKQVAIMDKRTGQVWLGHDARKLLNLPADAEIKVHPEANKDFDVFVQSTSINRHLVPHTKLIRLL